MSHPPFVRSALAAAAAALLCACERSEPAPAASAPPAEAAPSEVAAAAPAEPEASGPVVIPPFDPSLPTLALEPPAPVPPRPIAAKPPERSPRRAESPTATAAAEPAHPPLDALLRAPHLPRTEPSTVDLDLSPTSAEARPAPKPPGALDQLGRRIRLEQRKDAIGPAGPRQGTLYETEAGLRIPVDQSISLEGGVRVNSRDEPGAKQPDRRSTPRVGVEVRF